MTTEKFDFLIKENRRIRKLEAVPENSIKNAIRQIKFIYFGAVLPSQNKRKIRSKASVIINRT
jgi:hypothetical protein